MINFNSQGFSMIWFTNKTSLSSTTRRNALKCVCKLVLVVIKTKYIRYQNNRSSKKTQTSNKRPRNPFVTSQIHLTYLHINQIFLKLSSSRRNTVLYPLYVESKKKWDKWTYKTERDSQTQRKDLWSTRGGGPARELGTDMNILLYLKWITNKDLLYSTWNSAQRYAAAWMGGEFGRERYMHMYGWVPSLSTWNYHNIVNQLYPNTK